MPKRRRKKGGRRREATPITAAGLIRFYDEDVSGVKINPGIVIFITLLLLTFVLLANTGILPI